MQTAVLIATLIFSLISLVYSRKNLKLAEENLKLAEENFEEVKLAYAARCDRAAKDPNP